MADRATLITLSVIAAALAVVVVIDGGGGGTVVESRRVVPDFRPSAVQRITVRNGDRAPVVVARDGDDFVLVEPMQAPADAAAVDDLLGTVELLSWRRRGGEPAANRGLAPPVATLELELAGGARVELGIGAHLDELDRTWVSYGGDSYLVDGYAARALVREATELRSRRPLPFRRDALTGIEIHRGDAELILSGRPLAVHLDTGGAVRADPAAAAELVRRLHELRFQSFATAGAEPASDALTVRVIGASAPLRLVELGPCPGDPASRLIDSSAGTGCVAAAELAALAEAAAAGSELIDRRLVYRDGDRATAVSLDAGEHSFALEARGRVWTVAEDGGEPRPADPEAVRDWLDELSGTIEGDPIAAGAVKPSPPEATVELTHGADLHERITVHHDPDRGLLARRGDEPVLWPLAPDSISALIPPGHFRSRQLLAGEPWALRRARALAAGRVTEEIVRGELASDWTAKDAAAVAPEVVERLRAIVGGLRAERFAAAGEAAGLRAPRRVVELELDPPPGGTEPASHRIELGASADEGCYARVDGGAPVVLAQPECDALAGPWTR